MSLASLAFGLFAAVLSAADSGTSFGPQFLAAEGVWFAAAGVGLAALALGFSSIVWLRGRRLGVAAVAVVVLAGPVAVFVVEALPAA